MPRVRFQEQVVLVTGAAHGIGAAVARRLHGEGATVVLADHDLDAADRLAADLGERVLAVRCDVRDRESVDGALRTVTQAYGRLDQLVTVAGGAIGSPDLTQLDDEQWEAELDLNLTGVVRSVRAALPLLRASARAAVVMVSSVNGLAAVGGEGYGAAKAGLSNLAQNLAVRHGPEAIRVNVVAPASIRTRAWDDQQESLALLPRLYPLGRIGEPEEVAAAVAFLASAEALWITGVTLPVDGGLLAGPFRFMQHLVEEHGRRDGEHKIDDSAHD
ncbi:SDR family NAD(P)-dependent oxidoreductase [Georgenia alba]|uniref:SDR family NAD(P)-dependent oxidoreductase n=1 Tax=Georgenia alba TaxID=2233858 RepID=A0ABW2Q461_9MICO